MRIVSWNMNNAGRARHREARAWEYLLDVVRPDVALLQEVRRPGSPKSSFDTLTNGYLLHREFSAHHGWGTAIYTRNLELQELPASGFADVDGRCVFAEATAEDGNSLLVASLHAPTEPSVFPRLADCIEDVVARSSMRPLIIGGDFNTARAADAIWPGYQHGEFWSRVDTGWLADCHYRQHGVERNTLVRGRDNDHKVQCDHVLVSNGLVDAITSVSIPDEEEFKALDVSDHLPVVVELLWDADRARGA